MAQLICDNHTMLSIISRFGIPLGFAEKSIEEVCCENGIDSITFLAIVNLLLRDGAYTPRVEGVSLIGVVEFLRRSHEYYLGTKLPKIRTKLIGVLGDDKISRLIIQYFDDYVMQIKEHLRYEEEELFPYIERLTKGESTKGYCVELFCQKHDHIAEPLREFKDVIIKYYNAQNSEEVVSVIHSLLSYAYDLSKHNDVEDRLLVPLVRKEEEEKKF